MKSTDAAEWRQQHPSGCFTGTAANPKVGASVLVVAAGSHKSEIHCV